MSDWTQALYRHVPPFARNWAASARGWQLRRERIGPESDRLVVEALERDYWEQDRWQAWLDERLATILNGAATAPYYREQLSSLPADSLASWPVLEKDSLRASASSFLADGASGERLRTVATSGTTGKPIKLWRSRRVSRAWYALVEARMRRWFGLESADRWANVGGQVIVPVSRTKPPFWVWNQPMRQLYMSSYHLAPDWIAAYLEALRDYRIRYLHGYTSSLYALALSTPADVGKSLSIRVALTNAEPVESYQREAIESAFGCPVVAT